MNVNRMCGYVEGVLAMLLRFNVREAILMPSSALKGVRIRGSKVGISDDVHKDIKELSTSNLW